MQIKTISPLFVFLLFIFALPVNAEKPASIETLITAGDTYLNNGEVQAAFKAYNQAFRAAPDNLEANYKLGQAAAALKDFESAVMAFERVLIIDPDFVQAKIEMAKAFYNLGATGTAKQYFKEALEADLPEEVHRSLSAFIAQLNGEK